MLMPRARMKNKTVRLGLASSSTMGLFWIGLFIDCEGWNTPVYSLKRWLSHNVHHWASIPRLLPTFVGIVKIEQNDVDDGDDDDLHRGRCQGQEWSREQQRQHRHHSSRCSTLSPPSPSWSPSPPPASTRLLKRSIKGYVRQGHNRHRAMLSVLPWNYWQAVCSSAFVRRVSLAVSETESIKIQTFLGQRKGHLPCQGPAEAQRPLESSFLLRPWPSSGLPPPSLALAL